MLPKRGNSAHKTSAAGLALVLVAVAVLVLAGCSPASLPPPSSRAPIPSGTPTLLPPLGPVATPSPDPRAQSPSQEPTARPSSTPPPGPTTRPLSESSDPDLVKINWGKEVTPDQIIEMGKAGQIAGFQWHIMPNIVRITTTDNQIFHMRNERYGIDMIKALEKAGVKMGKDGIPIDFSFCN